MSGMNCGTRKSPVFVALLFLSTMLLMGACSSPEEAKGSLGDRDREQTADAGGTSGASVDPSEESLESGGEVTVAVPTEEPLTEPVEDLKTEEGWVSVGKADSLMDYLDYTLIPEWGYANFGKTYYAPYLELTTDGYTYPICGYAQDVEGGVVNAYISEFDGDGQQEMLVLFLEDETSEDGIKCTKLRYRMYEQEDREVYLAAEQDAAYGAIGGADVLEYAVYVRDTGDSVSLVERYEGYVCVLADGSTYGICVRRYDGNGFVEDFEKSYSGSDFSDMEEEIVAAAWELGELGFTETAARLDTDLRADERDGLWLLFLADGRNMNLFETDWYGDYYGTGDLMGLGAVEYRFFHSKVDYQTAFEITGYEVQRDDFSSHGDGVTVNAFFDRIVFQGEDADAIDWLNRKILELEERYRPDEEELKSLVTELSEYPFGDTEWEYQPMSLEQVYYDEDGNVSVCYSWYWYMGGVANNGWEGANYNVRTREELFLPKILGVDNPMAVEMVKEALLEEYDIDESNDIWSAYDFRFCFDESSVTVFFDPYELGQGGWGISVTLQRI